MEGQAAGRGTAADHLNRRRRSGGRRDARLPLVPPTPHNMRRGKHELAFHDKQFVIRTAKGDVAVPYTAIRQLAVRGEARAARAGVVAHVRRKARPHTPAAPPPPTRTRCPADL